MIKKLENTVACAYLILKGEVVVGTFYEIELQKTNQSVEKVIKRKGDILYNKWKGYDSSYKSWIDKKDSINDWIFSRTKILGVRVKVELDFSNYATNADLKNAAGVDTSKFAEKSRLS